VGWIVKQNDDDTLTLTSPAGIAYAREPAGKMSRAPKVLFDAAATNENAAASSDLPNPGTEPGTGSRRAG
jgi:hypothetical protein